MEPLSHHAPLAIVFHPFRYKFPESAFLCVYIDAKTLPFWLLFIAHQSATSHVQSCSSSWDLTDIFGLPFVNKHTTTLPILCPNYATTQHLWLLHVAHRFRHLTGTKSLLQLGSLGHFWITFS